MQMFFIVWIKNWIETRINRTINQATYDSESRNPSLATLWGGKYFHHCAIPTPQKWSHWSVNIKVHMKQNLFLHSLYNITFEM